MMTSTVTFEEIDYNNLQKTRNDIHNYMKNLVKDFSETISDRTENFSKKIEFGENALCTNLYDGAIKELQDYHCSLVEELVFNNPDSQLRQALIVYETW